MINSPPRVLFLSHSASRNGATILLVQLLRWLKTQVDWEFEVLVNGRGPMLGEFKSICKTTVCSSPNAFMKVIPQHWRDEFQYMFNVIQMNILMPGRRFDIIYANTSSAWSQVGVLARRAPALLWHIHEMGFALSLSMGRDRINKAFPNVTRFVAVSNSVRNTLVNEFNVPYFKVDVINGFVMSPDFSLAEKLLKRQRIRKALDWPEDAFVVGGCGSLGWRKGTDLFLQIAHIISLMSGYEKIRFLWVGGNDEEDQESLEFTHDLFAFGLQERCSRISSTAEVSDLYFCMDAFALTSREDPFPLVMLEAGAHGIPVVCFADSGGGVEFIDDGIGLIAPYLDIVAFTNHIKRLHDSPDCCMRMGERALKKVQTHYIVEVQGPKLLQSIDRCLTTGRKQEKQGACY